MKGICRFLIASAAFACTPDAPSEGAPPANAPQPHLIADKALPSPSARAEAPPSEVKIPATWVYGIKIPMGMKPAMSPDKVYRFEGTPPLSQVVELVGGQITAKQKLREVNGWLFRFAKPTAGSGATADRELAVRVFGRSGSAGGSILDIWLEKEYTEALPDKSAASSTYTFRKLKSPVLRSGLTDRQRQERASSLKETMSIMKKVESGEPLSKEEFNSKVFY